MRSNNKSITLENVRRARLTLYYTYQCVPEMYVPIRIHIHNSLYYIIYYHYSMLLHNIITSLIECIIVIVYLW